LPVTFPALITCIFVLELQPFPGAAFLVSATQFEILRNAWRFKCFSYCFQVAAWLE
jgi:hypothetical protein